VRFKLTYNLVDLKRWRGSQSSHSFRRFEQGEFSYSLDIQDELAHVNSIQFTTYREPSATYLAGLDVGEAESGP